MTAHRKAADDGTGACVVRDHDLLQSNPDGYVTCSMVCAASSTLSADARKGHACVVQLVNRLFDPDEVVFCSCSLVLLFSCSLVLLFSCSISVSLVFI